MAITVTNEGDTPLVMQAEVFEWKQKADSTDELIPTEDVAMAPPVLKLAPKARQVLRLANLRPVIPGQQLTYRLLVREIPEALPPAEGAQVQVALAFSIPIFVTPADAKQRLTCTVPGTTAESIQVACENQGHAYAQPVTFDLTAGSGEALATENVTGGYILPGASRSFKISRAAKSPLAGPARLTVTQDDGSKLAFDVVLAD